MSAMSIVIILTPSNRGRKSNSNKNSNKNAPKETKERIVFIIDIPPSNTCHCYVSSIIHIAYIISDSGAGHTHYIILVNIFQYVLCKKIKYKILLFSFFFELPSMLYIHLHRTYPLRF